MVDEEDGVDGGRGDDDDGDGMEGCGGVYGLHGEVSDGSEVCGGRVMRWWRGHKPLSGISTERELHCHEWIGGQWENLRGDFHDVAVSVFHCRTCRATRVGVFVKVFGIFYIFVQLHTRRSERVRKLDELREKELGEVLYKSFKG